MHTTSEILNTLNGMAAPAALVTACSLLLLGVYDKYSKVVASLRALYSERRERYGDYGPHHEHRGQQIDIECNLLQQRLRYVLAQILAVATGMTLFLLTSLVVGGAVLFGAPTMDAAAFFAFTGVAALIVAMVLAAAEARFIWRVIRAESVPLASTNGHTFRSASRSGGSAQVKGNLR